MFALCGGAVIVWYAVAGGAGPGGDLPSGTPRWIRLTQYLLGLWPRQLPGVRVAPELGLLPGECAETGESDARDDAAARQPRPAPPPAARLASGTTRAPASSAKPRHAR